LHQLYHMCIGEYFKNFITTNYIEVERHYQSCFP
jgi:hypothetical protein